MKSKTAAAYRSRLMMAQDVVGEPECRTCDVDGLSLAVHEVESCSGISDAESKKAEYVAMRDRALADGNKSDARGLFWVVSALSRLSQELQVSA